MNTTTGTIIVTGASRGIGAAIALALARAGLYRGLPVAQRRAAGGAGRVQRRAARAACRLPPTSRKATACAPRLRRSPQLGAPIVGLVNNAGIHLEGPSDSFSQSDYDAVIATNATAVFVGCQHVYPHLVRQAAA